MKNFKLIMPAVIGVLMLFLSTGFVMADNNEPSTISDLKYQIGKEILDVFRSPISIYFEDKNIKGEAYVTITVQENGKIIVESVNGSNNILNSLLEKRIRTRNLWTDTKFAGRDFVYHIIMNQHDEN
ncbi:MAG: hypothetical protein PHN88_13385 [Ignavibacteria bacterium]|nr:hypothetical protein [Ignavibacteria bacterium]